MMKRCPFPDTEQCSEITVDMMDKLCVPITWPVLLNREKCVGQGRPVLLYSLWNVSVKRNAAKDDQYFHFRLTGTSLLLFSVGSHDNVRRHKKRHRWYVRAPLIGQTTHGLIHKSVRDLGDQISPEHRRRSALFKVVGCFSHKRTSKQLWDFPAHLN